MGVQDPNPQTLNKDGRQQETFDQSDQSVPDVQLWVDLLNAEPGSHLGRRFSGQNSTFQSSHSVSLRTKVWEPPSDRGDQSSGNRLATERTPTRVRDVSVRGFTLAKPILV